MVCTYIADIIFSAMVVNTLFTFVLSLALVSMNGKLCCSANFYAAFESVDE